MPIVYPMVRYALYSAIALLLVTVLHRVVAFGVLLAISVLATIVTPSPQASFVPAWLKNDIYVILPSTGLLSETRCCGLFHFGGVVVSAAQFIARIIANKQGEGRAPS